MVEFEKWDASEGLDDGTSFPVCYLKFRELPEGQVARTIEILEGELLLDLDADGNVAGVEGIGIDDIGYVELVMILTKVQVKGGCDGFGKEA